MSKVKAKNTKPELLIRSLLHNLGFRFRLHQKNLPGKPDIFLPKYKTIIFVNGCFWHQHKGCKKATIPYNNHDKWQKKLERNVHRDKENKDELESLGWKVLVVWECELKNYDILKSKLIDFLKL